MAESFRNVNGNVMVDASEPIRSGPKGRSGVSMRGRECRSVVEWNLIEPYLHTYYILPHIM